MLSITIAVPQCTMLGPFVFSVYINNLPNSCNFDIMLSANNTVLLCSEKISRSLKHKSETELQNIENWFVPNKLKINHNKTK